MSFLYYNNTGVGAPGIALAINAFTPAGFAPLEHAPSPLDPMIFEGRMSDLTLFATDQELTGYGYTAGKVHCGEAVWAHVNWDAAYYGGLNPRLLTATSYSMTVQVVGVMVAGVFLDGPGFPFTPPNWDNRLAPRPDPPEFRVVWNPGGGDIIDFVNSSGGQTGSASWDDATKTLTIVPQTYHPQTVFHPQGIELVPAPQFVDPAPVVIPPVFGELKSSPEPTALATSLVIPPVFGGLTVTPGSPDDVPPDEPPPPGQDPYGPPDGRPVVDSGDAIPGADRTGRSAAVRVSRVRVMGG